MGENDERRMANGERKAMRWQNEKEEEKKKQAQKFRKKRNDFSQLSA